MSTSWQLKLPPKIIFENDSVEKAGDIAGETLGGKALIVTDKIMEKTGILDRLKKSLESRKIPFEIFDKVSGEPVDSYISEGLDIFNEKGCRYIIALGGGSPIDTGKAVSVMTANPGKISDYRGLGAVKKKGVPLVAVPTTGGTGSEVTPFTIITDSSSDVKMLIGSEHIIPHIAILDPTLTLSCPPSLTAAVGIDALCHAIESYASRKANPMSDVFALKAIGLIYNNLKTVYKSGKDLEARAKVMMGATLAGMAFGNSSVTLVHGMSRPIGANFHVPHGVSNAALLKVVMGFSYSSSRSRYADIAAAMVPDMWEAETEAAAKASVDLVARLIDDLDIPTLAELGIKRQKLKELAPSMARAAIESGSPSNNPRIATEEEIIGLYLKAY